MKDRISVVGLGAMGSALARCLLDNGYVVTVWNRTPDRAAPLVADGAVLAGSAAEAFEASPATITCIASHDATIALLENLPGRLEGKTLIELSTGGAEEAERLSGMVEEAGADCLIGIINAYPTGIGKEETVLSIFGREAAWQEWSEPLRALGGRSAHAGTEPGMAAALFAALFTVRQGFMFGMIYGGLVCRKAGLPLDTFAAQIPVSMGVLPAYHGYFSKTVPTRDFDNPPATMKVYADALEDALRTFEAVGAPDDLPRLFSDLARRGVEAGLGDKALTALVEELGG